MEKGRNIESIDGEIPLPEALIQHIQSYMTGKEAARTTLISKSWYNAWLTRPSLNIDDREFGNDIRGFEEYATKRMQRYQDSSLKLSFRLCSRGEDIKIVRNLIVNAMKIGATNVELELPHSHTLPQELLECQNLVRLCLRRCAFDGKYVIRCSDLKSLALYNVKFTSYDVFEDILMCCSVSIEELSLSYLNYTTHRLALNGLHNLRHLFLFSVEVDSTFFTDFASRFPCLKDLSVIFCTGFTRVEIASTSLETVSFEQSFEAPKYKARFDVPNIRKFTWESSGLPSLSIDGGSREWELDITICCYFLPKTLWFLNLKELLAKFRLSKISLSVELRCIGYGSSERKVDIKVVEKPLVLENLTIDGPSSHCCALLVRLFGICRPKFITHYSLTAKCYPGSFENPFLVVLCKKLMHDQGITPNCGIPDQNKFGLFDLIRK